MKFRSNPASDGGWIA